MNPIQNNILEANRMISSLPSLFNKVIEQKEKTDDRDVVFLFDLLYVLEEISKISNATHGDKFPHVSYINEKLTRAKRVLDNCQSYFSQRVEEEKNKKKVGI